jgi:integrase
MLETGVSVKVVSMVLGHSNSLITERRYLHISDKYVMEAAMAANVNLLPTR